jgi:hypothetical protein
MQFRHLMKPLSNLARPTPGSAATLESKVAALDTATPESIAATALGEGEEELRAAAIGKLKDGLPLRTLVGLSESVSPPSMGLRRVAQERMAWLIDEGAVDFAELRAAGGDHSALLSVAGLCRNPDHLSQMVASIADPERLANLVTEGSSSHIRQLAAQRIDDPAQLKSLLKQVRDKDKSVYKIIKQKCDALRAEEKQVVQIETDIQAAYASLERHGHRVYDALFVPSFEHFHARWRALESHAAPEMLERAHQAIARCQDIIAKHLQQVTAQEAEKAHREAQRAAQKEAVEQAEASARQREETAALAAAQAAAAREAEEKARAERLAAEAHLLRQIGGLIGKAQGALREGDTGRASGLRRAIEEKLPNMATVPPHIAGQVRDLDVKLNELKQWKDFAVAPKRAELIQEMESLIGSSEPPQALADRIKQLQEDWKTISKGIVSDSEVDWQRFHQASQAAFKPCREFFEAQAKLRHDNLEKRQSVLERLRAFEAAQSGEHPDWRSVAVVLREAPQEWRRHSPVERVAGRTLQEEFDAAMGRLQSKLDAWHAGNAADKQALIQRAQQLLTKDAREAVEAVKQLQLRWKEVGAAERSQEQRLWQEFREHCDAVFQKRQQAQTEHTLAIETHKRQALALCEEAEQVAALSGSALIEGVAKIPQWRSAFEALGELPHIDERGLRERFERALKRCQTQLAQSRARDQEAAMTNLLEAARHIQNYGWAALSGESSDREALKQTAEAFVASVPQWPKGGAQALKDAWQKADAAGTDAGVHERALRLLCIRSEITTGKPTPPEDQALRREHQVQRLVERMGQPQDANAEAWDTLAFEWIRVGPVSPATHAPLLARFLRCRGERRS